MYKNFFGLRENPFNVSPDPRYLFLTPSTREALAGLTYGIESRKGIILLTGEVGTGKTTLLNKLLEWLRQKEIATAFVFNTDLSAGELFDYMLADFGIQSQGRSKSELLMSLNRWLLGRYRAGQTTVLIIDEAQNLSAQALEHVRLLTNLETSTEKLLQIVLAGQPELERKLKDPGLRQIRQRIVVRCATTVLTAAETHGYILERLRVAGADDGQAIFSSEAIDRVHLHARGVPRVINILCEHSLIDAYVAQQRPISCPVVDGVAREFELDHTEGEVAAQRQVALPIEPVLGDLIKFLQGLRQPASVRGTGEESV